MTSGTILRARSRHLRQVDRVMAGVFINRFGATPSADASSIVLVHGAGMDSTVWSQQARYLAARGFNVLAPDLPGHGQSGGASLKTIHAMGEWLAAMLADECTGSCVLVGHSMGSFVAMHAALSSDVRHLVLIGTAAKMPVHPDLIAAAKDQLPLAAALIGDWAFAPDYDHSRQALPSTSLRLSAIRLLERSAKGVLADDLIACTDFDSAIETTQRVNARKTIIAGGLDRMTPLNSAKKLASDGDAEIVVLNDVGHMPILEAPVEVRRRLAAKLTDDRVH